VTMQLPLNLVNLAPEDVIREFLPRGKGKGLLPTPDELGNLLGGTESVPWPMMGKEWSRWQIPLASFSHLLLRQGILRTSPVTRSS
jgi:hypothetical protein